MAKLVSKILKRVKCTVHDLCVEPSHTYNVEGLAVHNSGAGSLINYVLGITHVDPLRYNLLFSRFLSSNRCLDPKHFVFDKSCGKKQLKDVVIGDRIAVSQSNFVDVTNIKITRHTIICKISVNNEVFTCSSDHRWMVRRNNEVIQVKAIDIINGDILLSCDKNLMKNL